MVTLLNRYTSGNMTQSRKNFWIKIQIWATADIDGFLDITVTHFSLQSKKFGLTLIIYSSVNHEIGKKADFNQKRVSL